eukprot:610181-Prorocentrum_minimum.AAC.1
MRAVASDQSRRWPASNCYYTVPLLRHRLRGAAPPGGRGAVPLPLCHALPPARRGGGAAPHGRGAAPHGGAGAPEGAA